MAMVETETLLLPIFLTTDPHSPSHCRPLDRKIRYWGNCDERSKGVLIFNYGMTQTAEWLPAILDYK